MIQDPSPLFLPTSHNAFCSEALAVLMDLEVQMQRNQRFDTLKDSQLRPQWYSRYWNETSLQWIMAGNIIKKRIMSFPFEKNPTSPHPLNG